MSETELLHTLLDEVQALRDQVQRLQRRRLVPVAELAERLDVSEKTIKRRAPVIRDMHGAPKEKGSRATPYVSVDEWESGERLHTQSVQRHMRHAETAPERAGQPPG